MCDKGLGAKPVLTSHLEDPTSHATFLQYRVPTLYAYARARFRMKAPHALLTGLLSLS